MSTPSLRRSLSAVGAVAALTAGLVPALGAQPAFAATVSVSPTSSANNQVRTLTITGGTWAVPLAEQVSLERTSATADAIDGTVQASSTMTSLVVSFDLAAAAPADYNLVVTPGTAAASDTCTACFHVTGKLPTLSSVTPSSRAAGTSGSTTLAGTNLARGASVTVLKNGVADAAVTVSGIAVSSSTAATATVNAAAGATAGARSVRWTNTDGQSGTCSSCLVITTGLSITNAVPNQLGQGANKSVTFNGTGFQAGATLEITKPGLPIPPNGVTATNVQVAPDGEALTADLHVPGDEPTGSRTATITNPDGSSVSTTITINEAPVVTSVVEAVANDNPADDASQSLGTARSFRFNGSGFTNGTTFVLGPNVTASNYDRTHIGDPSPYIQATVTVSPTAELGNKAVIATNPDFGTSSCAACFEVTPLPTVTSVSPDAVGQSDTGTLTVNGTNFGTGATVTFPGGSGVSTTGPAVVAGNGQSLTVPYAVSAGATQGQTAVTVTNEDGGSGTCPTCLFVEGLDVTGIAPTFAANNNGTSQAFTISGSGFLTAGAGPTVQLVSDVEGQDPIDVNLTSSSTTSLEGTANIEIAAPGTYDVDVTNPGANPAAGRCSNCLTINGNDPVLTSISASRFAPGQVKTITLTGNNFSNGMVALPGVTGVTAGPVTAASPTSATVTISVASNATPGGTQNDAFTVQTSDGQTSGGQDVTIVAPPTLEIAWPANVTSDNASVFNAVLTNPAGGASFQGRIDVEFSGIEGLSAADLTLEHRANTSAAFADVTLSNGPDDTVIGFIPPQAGTALAAGQTQTTNLRFTIEGGAPAGDLDIESTYGDVAAGERTSTVATDADTLTVRSVPSPPQTVQGRAGDRSAKVTWGLPASDGNSAIIRYEVTAHRGNNDVATKNVNGATATTTTMTGLTNDAAHTFTVVAVNSAGDSAAGGPSPAVTPHTPRITVDLPAKLTAGGSPRSLTVSMVNDTITAYPEVRAELEITGPGGLSPKRIRVVNTSGGNSNRLELTGSDGSVKGRFPESGSVPIPSESALSTTLTIALDEAAPSGKLTFTVRLIDVSGSGTRRLSTGEDEATVNGSTNRFVPVKPDRFVNSSKGVGVSEGKKNGKTVVKIPDSVPDSASGVVVNVGVRNPNDAGYVQVYAAGAERSNRAVSFEDGEPQTQMTVSRFSGKRKIALHVVGAKAHLVVDLLGYHTDSLKSGGRLVPVRPQRIEDSRGSGNAGPRSISVKMPSDVPANAVAVLIDVTAVETRADGHLTAFKRGGQEPKTHALDFEDGRQHTNTYVTRINDKKRITVAVHGRTHVLVDLVGYYAKSDSWGGRFRELAPDTILNDSRSGTFRLELPGAVPDDASTVLLSVTAHNPGADGFLRAYATGTNRPKAFVMHWANNRDASNLVVSRVGDGGDVTLQVKGGSPDLRVEVLGYTTA